MGLKDYFKSLSEEAKAKVKTAFDEVETEQAETPAETPEKETKEKFVEAQLADGTLVNVEPDLQVGAMVTVEVEGEVMAAPDGNHELADGSIISTEGGVITNIEPASAEETEEEEMEQEPKAEERNPKKVITREEIENIFSEKSKELAEALKEDFAKMLEEVTKEQSELKDGFKTIVEGLAEMPTDKPAKEPKQNFGKVNKWRAKLDAMKSIKK